MSAAPWLALAAWALWLLIEAQTHGDGLAACTVLAFALAIAAAATPEGTRR